MKYQYIDYIVSEFQKRYPTVSTERLQIVLNKASDDELYRIANAIDRFGVENLVDFVEKSI